jgi:hypothetical protein
MRETHNQRDIRERMVALEGRSSVWGDNFARKKSWRDSAWRDKIS